MPAVGCHRLRLIENSKALKVLDGGHSLGHAFPGVRSRLWKPRLGLMSLLPLSARFCHPLFLTGPGCEISVAGHGYHSPPKLKHGPLLAIETLTGGSGIPPNAREDDWFCRWAGRGIGSGKIAPQRGRRGIVGL